MTMGELMFYGGMGGTAVFILLFAVSWAVYERKKKQLIRKIEQEL